MDIRKSGIESAASLQSEHLGFLHGVDVEAAVFDDIGEDEKAPSSVCTAEQFPDTTASYRLHLDAFS